MSVVGKILRSRKDASSNFITPFGKGHLESRLVLRPPKENHNNHLSFYVSTHSGCMMDCQMCHLTHTDQKSFLPANENQLTSQIYTLLQHYNERKQKEIPQVQWAYINFMARGEPLMSPTIQQNMPKMYKEWQAMCEPHDLKLRINISTIYPKGIGRFDGLHEMFGDTPVYIYYSLYSLDPDFREHWLPNAMDPLRALEVLKAWEDRSGIPITFHWPIIEGHNDSDESIEKIANMIEAMKFQGRYHLVRFNPPNSTYKEASQERMDYALKRFSQAFTNPKLKSKSIRRIGEDVYASCGTFWSPEDE